MNEVKADNYIDQFIFTDRLRGELQTLRTYPELIKLNPVLCFHGYAGTGKTTFAKSLCDELCGHSVYLPMNERSLANGFIEDEIKPLFRTYAIGASAKPYAKGIILDEFHNLAPRDQDKFKVVFDDVIDGLCGVPSLIVVCLNTTPTKSLSKCLTSPIYSRVSQFNFNTAEGDKDELYELVGKVKERYPLLSATEIFAWLPDMRVITRRGAMSQIMNN